VPEIAPTTKSNSVDLTLRDTLELHAATRRFVGRMSTNRIDAMELVFEGYGPIGELGIGNLGGRTIDDFRPVFPRRKSEGRGCPA